jgi:hypothetical protein
MTHIGRKYTEDGKDEHKPDLDAEDCNNENKNHLVMNTRLIPRKDKSHDKIFLHEKYDSGII